MAQAEPTPQASGCQKRLEFKFQPSADSVRMMRDSVRAVMQEFKYSDDQVESVVLGLDEVVMNACEHGSTGSDPTVELDVDLFADRIAFEVRDRGAGCSKSSTDLPNDEAENGRGLFLIHHTMDEVCFSDREGGGTVVRLVKRRG